MWQFYQFIQLKIRLVLSVCGFGLLATCVPVSQQAGFQTDGKDTEYVNAKALRLDDYIYEPNIRTVLFYPYWESKVNKLDFPVLQLEQAATLKLEFDELGDQYHNYNFMLVHCNADWKQSILNNFEFLTDFNEFSVDNYEMSLNTRNAYIHYNFTMPKVKITGNYVVVVYKDRNPKDIVLTRRFVVYQNAVALNPEPKFAVDPSQRFSNQQIDFTLTYGNLNIFNPKETVKIYLRQNGRWDNAITNLAPLYIREDQNLLDYHFFNNENTFPGVNEYRLFDTRSIRFRGQGMSNTSFNNEKAEAFIMPETTRNQKSYVQFFDLNGRFMIQNWETQMGNVEGDYVWTYFTLNCPEPVDGNVFVFGLLSDWALDPKFKMTYNPTEKAYKARILLKQGVYNYAYVVQKNGPKPDEVYFEGAYNMAQNVYDIFAYFRPIGARYDHVVGYTKLDYFGTGSR